MPDPALPRREWREFPTQPVPDRETFNADYLRPAATQLRKDCIYTLMETRTLTRLGAEAMLRHGVEEIEIGTPSRMRLGDEWITVQRAPKSDG